MSAPDRSAARPAFDAERLRRDFPIFERTMRGKPLVYLDSAASAQKPRVVIDAVSEFYSREYSNIHRGVYELSERSTARFEEARRRAQRFLGAADAAEIVFVRNATEGINLVARSFARGRLSPGDEILITHMEHHANLVPWQMVCGETGARLVVAPINDAGELRLDELAGRIGERTRLLAVTHVSNALGSVNPVHEITDLAHRRGVPVLVDGAQAAPRMPVDVSSIGCDFYVCSGHKLYGPSGVGVLYGRLEQLAAMPPYQGGGEMIQSVSFEGTLFKTPPHRFEAGTPDIAGAVGLAAAIDYLEAVGMRRVEAHEAELLDRGTELLEAIPGLRLVGTAKQKVGVLSFAIDGLHPHDIATVLDQEGVAIRAGHHCAQPVMERMGVPATARASVGLYSTARDLEVLASALRKAIEMFR